MQERWNTFLEELFEDTLQAWYKTREHEYLEEKEKQLNERLDALCSKEQRVLIDDFLFETELDKERGIAFIYRKGMQDGLLILKTMGVF